MTAWTSGLPPVGSALWPALLLIGHLVAGLAIGLLHWQGLRWSVERRRGRPGIAMVIAFSLGRFVLLAALLLAIAREGAMPLLAAALGLLMARHIAMRRQLARERSA